VCGQEGGERRGGTRAKLADIEMFSIDGSYGGLLRGGTGLTMVKALLAPNVLLEFAGGMKYATELGRAMMCDDGARMSSPH
jgi:hypothetical protein